LLGFAEVRDSDIYQIHAHRVRIGWHLHPLRVRIHDKNESGHHTLQKAILPSRPTVVPCFVSIDYVPFYCELLWRDKVETSSAKIKEYV